MSKHCLWNSSLNSNKFCRVLHWHCPGNKLVNPSLFGSDSWWHHLSSSTHRIQRRRAVTHQNRDHPGEESPEVQAERERVRSVMTSLQQEEVKPAFGLVFFFILHLQVCLCFLTSCIYYLLIWCPSAHLTIQPTVTLAPEGVELALYFYSCSAFFFFFFFILLLSFLDF